MSSNIGGGEGRLAFEFAVEMSKRHDVVLMYPGTVPESLPEGARLRVYPIRSIDYTLPALTGRGVPRASSASSTPSSPTSSIPTPRGSSGAIIQAWAFVHGRALLLHRPRAAVEDPGVGPGALHEGHVRGPGSCTCSRAPTS